MNLNNWDPTSKLVAIDPGIHGCGVATFASDQLYWAGYVPKVSLDTTRHILNAAAMGVWYATGDWSRIGRSFGRLLIEKPQVYQTAKQKGAQQDVADLLVVVGALLGLLSPCACVSVTTPAPHDWKGSVPKDTMLRRIVSKLSTEEKARIEEPHGPTSRARASLRHNILDAVGLGLWKVGRLK